MIDVVNDLKDSGYNFDISWFDPFFEFRFPHHGNVTIDNVNPTRNRTLACAWRRTVEYRNLSICRFLIRTFTVKVLELFLIVIYYYAKDVEFIKEYRNQR
jgi:uncharacterized protein (DUF2126 family)